LPIEQTGLSVSRLVTGNIAGLEDVIGWSKKHTLTMTCKSVRGVLYFTRSHELLEVLLWYSESMGPMLKEYQISKHNHFEEMLSAK